MSQAASHLPGHVAIACHAELLRNLPFIASVDPVRDVFLAQQAVTPGETVPTGVSRILVGDMAGNRLAQTGPAVVL